MKPILKTLLPIVLTLATLNTATANTGKLPFVGTREFNFGMGMGTSQKITIYKNGNVVIHNINLMADTPNSSAPYDIVIYNGKYKSLMPGGDGAYYQIKGNKISLVNKSGKTKRDCEDSTAGNNLCTTTLYKD